MFYNHLRQMVRAARNKGSTEPRLKITFADGRTITTDAGTAIDIIKERPATVVKVADCQGTNGMLSDLLTGICGEA